MKFFKAGSSGEMPFLDHLEERRLLPAELAAYGTSQLHTLRPDPALNGVRIIGIDAIKPDDFRAKPPAKAARRR